MNPGPPDLSPLNPAPIKLWGVIVTIDGKAASGKSSVSGGVARALGIPYVSSGLLYRAATRLGLEAGLDLERAEALLAHLQKMPLRLEPLAEGNRVSKPLFSQAAGLPNRPLRMTFLTRN